MTKNPKATKRAIEQQAARVPKAKPKAKPMQAKPMPGTALVTIPGQNVIDTNLKYKAQRAWDKTKAGITKAKNFASKNKAALIASGVGAAGIAGTGLAAHAIGKARGKAQAQNES